MKIRVKGTDMYEHPLYEVSFNLTNNGEVKVERIRTIKAHLDTMYDVGIARFYYENDLGEIEIQEWKLMQTPRIPGYIDTTMIISVGEGGIELKFMRALKNGKLKLSFWGDGKMIK